MIKTLRESKAKLSELVDLAASGEEVIITVRGKPKARLSRVTTDKPRDMRAWVSELKALQRTWAGRKKPMDSAGILDSLREERA